MVSMWRSTVLNNLLVCIGKLRFQRVFVNGLSISQSILHCKSRVALLNSCDPISITFRLFCRDPVDRKFVNVLLSKAIWT
jgi:hypothetical protein